MTQENERLSSKEMFTRIWEDTVILAVRDLQWAKAIERGKPMPNALLKLDGHAETALGDAITSVDDRFFLFEFKSDASAGGSEFYKPLVTIMKRVAKLQATSKVKAFFEMATRAAHHFVFPEYHPAAFTEGPGVPTKPAKVATDGYYDAACAMTSDSYTLGAKVDIESMLYGPEYFETYGLPLVEMAAYLKYLTSSYESWVLEKALEQGKAGDVEVRVPMKALILSDRGFFWPCADMTNLVQVYQVLNGHYGVDLQSRMKETSYPPVRLPAADDEPKPSGKAQRRSGAKP